MCMAPWPPPTPRPDARQNYKSPKVHATYISVIESHPKSNWYKEGFCTAKLFLSLEADLFRRPSVPLTPGHLSLTIKPDMAVSCLH